MHNSRCVSSFLASGGTVLPYAQRTIASFLGLMLISAVVASGKPLWVNQYQSKLHSYMSLLCTLTFPRGQPHQSGW